MTWRIAAVRLYETYWKRRATFANLAQLERSQYWSPDQLVEHQMNGLRRLVDHAISHSAFYRESLGAVGASGSSIHTIKDLGRLPLTTRSSMQVRHDDFRTTDPTLRAFPKSTGGSTGEPLRFHVEHASDDWRMAASHRGYAWAGVPPGSRVFYLWGVPIRSNRPPRTWLKQRLHHALYGRIPFSTFELGESTIADAHRVLNKASGGSIVGYASSVFEMARLLETAGLQPPPLKSIVVGAEKLYSHQRLFIERVFAAPVFETYGSREFMLIGAECDHHKGLHLTAENHVLEIVDDAGAPVAAGEEGNVVITDLTNRAFPFIRYLNGDRAVLGDEACSCGRTLPLLSAVTGRTAEIIRLSNGVSLSGLFFPHLLKDVPWLRKYQVVETSQDHMTLRIVVGPGFVDSSLEPLRAEINLVSQGLAHLAVTIVDEIPLTAAGKHRVVSSKSAPASGPS